MYLSILAALFAISGTALSMFGAGIALLVIGLLAAKKDITHARDISEIRGINKIVALTPLCFAIPLAVFGAEHLSSAQSLVAGVPAYMPWRMFWVFFVGFALIASSLSIAANRQVRWSGLLFGVMMFLFVGMLHLPRAITAGGLLPWTIVAREMSFGGGGLVLAGTASSRDRDRQGRALITVGRVLIALTAIFFGVQHFLHPLALPGVPLAKQMPTWIPVRAFIDYITGASLVLAGFCFLLAWKTRLVATYVGAWIVLLVAVIYGPVLMQALLNPSADMQIEGLNYFADTLLFGGVILSLAQNRSGEGRDRDRFARVA